MLILTDNVSINGILTGEPVMDDFVRIKEPTQTEQSQKHSFAKDNFEEELRRQNISTMVQIYGEEYLK